MERSRDALNMRFSLTKKLYINILYSWLDFQYPFIFINPYQDISEV